MNVSFPLSLKFSFWLLLNLLLLAAGLVLFLGAQSGVGWDALVRGPAGNRAQELGRTVAMEFSAETDAAAARNVLQQFGRTYGADFFAVHPNLPGTTVPREDLPHRVGLKIDEGRNGPGGGPGRRGPPDASAPPPIGNGRGDDITRRTEDEIRGRFLMRAGEPTAFWLGVRVPTGRPVPVTIVIRTESWWVLMGLLDLQPWLLAAAAAFVLSVLCWLPFVGGLRAAIVSVTNATEKIADGKFQTRVTTNRRDELGALGHAVNRMAAQLEEKVQGQKRFLGDVAHELGSPLARLQVGVELLQRDAPAALHAQVADVHDEVQQIAELVNELLAFTKAGLRARDATLAAIELKPLLTSILTKDDPAGRVTLAVPSEIHVEADAVMLGRAISNLIRNALRYAAEAPITLSVTAVGNSVTLIVADEGPGVSPDALEHLGEPFFRTDHARSRETGGTGLGLAIVKSCVQACRGTLHFSNGVPRGLIAEIVLQRAGAFSRA